jgi:HlyD family secretion protein
VDREIAASVQRRTRLRQAATVVLPLLLLAGAIAWLPAWLRPTVTASRLRTAVVTTGPIDATITASGLVVPAFDRVLSSPLDARVLRVLQRPGAVLAPGDAVLELDVSESAQALARAENDLKMKDNQQQQTRLGYEKSLVDLDGQIEVKTLEIETRRATLHMHQQLADRGLLSQEELRKTALALRQAEVELAQLQNARQSAARTTEVQLEGLALERATLARDVSERRRLLDLATTKADRAGVLTWVVADEGVLVRRGDVIARIADLSAFRIDASVSDIHAGRIRTGLPVAIRIDEDRLEGTVQEVYPTVENGAIRFMVGIADAKDVALRPSLRADVQVITSSRGNTVKVQRGTFADGTGPRQVFVRIGNRAVRTTATLGVASFDEVEVISGLVPGDEVILSDMRDYEHLAELRIR